MKGLCIVVAAFPAASSAIAREMLPKPKDAFKDAKIGRTYSGTIKKVEINIRPSDIKASDRQKIRGAGLRAATTIE